MHPDTHPSRESAARPGHGSRPPTGEAVRRLDVHDPQLNAVDVARQIDELMRALSYATRRVGPRLEYAADVYEVLGSLRAALTKLPQACGQLADFLRRQDAAGTLRAERGFPHASRPEGAVEAATVQLAQAAVASNVTATAFGRAQEAISGLAHVEREQPPLHAQQTRWPQTVEPGALDRGRVIEP